MPTWRLPALPAGRLAAGRAGRELSRPAVRDEDPALREYTCPPYLPLASSSHNIQGPQADVAELVYALA